jgi:hypothetical protein
MSLDISFGVRLILRHQPSGAVKTLMVQLAFLIKQIRLPLLVEIGAEFP